MIENQNALIQMRQKLGGIEFRAKRLSDEFTHFQKEAEALKVEILQSLLEKQIEFEARRRGVELVINDRNRLRTSALVTAGGFILGELLTQDKWAALNTGLSSLDVSLKGFGSATWKVLLGKRILVASSDNTPQDENWLPRERLKLAMDRVKKKALRGETLGNLDDVLLRLERGVEELSGPTPQLLR